MPELEAKIVAWRAGLYAAMPRQHERIRELEAHLRDHIEHQLRSRVSASEAFDEAVKRIGEPQIVAQEFGRLEKRCFGLWRPTAVVYGLVVAGCFWYFVIAYYFVVVRPGNVISSAPVSGVPLLLASYLAVGSGCTALVGAGMLGACILLGQQMVAGHESLMRRRDIFRLLLLSGVFLTVGPGLQVVWARVYGPAQNWLWPPGPFGVLSVTIFTSLQLMQFKRFADEKMRTILAIIGTVVAVLGWRAAIIWPHGGYLVSLQWVLGFGMLSQAAIWFLHLRAQREPTDLASA